MLATRKQSVEGFSEWQERLLNVLIWMITGANLWLLVRSNGRIGTRFLGRPVLLLTTIGRSSGEARTIPLFYLREGERLVVVASRAGTSRHPGWYHNIERNPLVAVQLAKETRAMTARVATEEEAQALWPSPLLAISLCPWWRARIPEGYCHFPTQRPGRILEHDRCLGSSGAPPALPGRQWNFDSSGIRSSPS